MATVSIGSKDSVVFDIDTVDDALSPFGDDAPPIPEPCWQWKPGSQATTSDNNSLSLSPNGNGRAASAGATSSVKAKATTTSKSPSMFSRLTQSLKPRFWKRKWVWLENGALHYSPGPSETAERTIQLTQVTSVMTVNADVMRRVGADEKLRQNGWLLRAEGREYYFATNEPLLRDEWVHCLLFFTQKLNGSSGRGAGAERHGDCSTLGDHSFIGARDASFAEPPGTRVGASSVASGSIRQTSFLESTPGHPRRSAGGGGGSVGDSFTRRSGADGRGGTSSFPGDALDFAEHNAAVDAAAAAMAVRGNSAEYGVIRSGSTLDGREGGRDRDGGNNNTRRSGGGGNGNGHNGPGSATGTGAVALTSPLSRKQSTLYGSSLPGQGMRQAGAGGRGPTSSNPQSRPTSSDVRGGRGAPVSPLMRSQSMPSPAMSSYTAKSNPSGLGYSGSGPGQGVPHPSATGGKGKQHGHEHHAQQKAAEDDDRFNFFKNLGSLSNQHASQHRQGNGRGGASAHQPLQRQRTMSPPRAPVSPLTSFTHSSTTAASPRGVAALDSSAGRSNQGPSATAARSVAVPPLAPSATNSSTPASSQGVASPVARRPSISAEEIMRANADLGDHLAGLDVDDHGFDSTGSRRRATDGQQRGGGQRSTSPRGDLSPQGGLSPRGGAGRRRRKQMMDKERALLAAGLSSEHDPKVLTTPMDSIAKAQDNTNSTSLGLVHEDPSDPSYSLSALVAEKRKSITAQNIFAFSASPPVGSNSANGEDEQDDQDPMGTHRHGHDAATSAELLRRQCQQRQGRRGRPETQKEIADLCLHMWYPPTGGNMRTATKALASAWLSPCAADQFPLSSSSSDNGSDDATWNSDDFFDSEISSDDETTSSESSAAASPPPRAPQATRTAVPSSLSLRESQSGAAPNAPKLRRRVKDEVLALEEIAAEKAQKQRDEEALQKAQRHAAKKAAKKAAKLEERQAQFRQSGAFSNPSTGAFVNPSLGLGGRMRRHGDEGNTWSEKMDRRSRAVKRSEKERERVRKHRRGGALALVAAQTILSMPSPATVSSDIESIIDRLHAVPRFGCSYCITDQDGLVVARDGKFDDMTFSHAGGILEIAALLFSQRSLENSAAFNPERYSNVPPQRPGSARFGRGPIPEICVDSHTSGQGHSRHAQRGDSSTDAAAAAADALGIAADAPVGALSSFAAFLNPFSKSKGPSTPSLNAGGVAGAGAGSGGSRLPLWRSHQADDSTTAARTKVDQTTRTKTTGSASWRDAHVRHGSGGAVVGRSRAATMAPSSSARMMAIPDGGGGHVSGVRRSLSEPPSLSASFSQSSDNNDHHPDHDDDHDVENDALSLEGTCTEFTSTLRDHGHLGQAREAAGPVSQHRHGHPHPHQHHETDRGHSQSGRGLLRVCSAPTIDDLPINDMDNDDDNYGDGQGGGVFAGDDTAVPNHSCLSFYASYAQQALRKGGPGGAHRPTQQGMHRAGPTFVNDSDSLANTARRAANRSPSASGHTTARGGSGGYGAREEAGAVGDGYVGSSAVSASGGSVHGFTIGRKRTTSGLTMSSAAGCKPTSSRGGGQPMPESPWPAALGAPLSVEVETSHRVLLLSPAGPPGLTLVVSALHHVL